MGRGRDRLQLQRRARRHAGRHGAGPRRDHASDFGPAERRDPALGRRTQHLPVLAGVHGQLRAQVRCRRSAPDRRLLRNHPRTYPGDEIRAARNPGPCPHGRSSQGRSCSSRRPGRASRKKIAARRQDCPRRIRRHGRNRSSQGHEHSEGTGRREVPEVSRRGRNQHPRQPARLGPHEQSGAVAAAAAAGWD